MSTKLDIALALLSMVVPFLVASIITDLDRKAAIKILLSLGVVGTATYFYKLPGFSISAFLCAGIALLSPYSADIMLSRAPAPSESILGRVVTDRKMRDWCRRRLKAQGWKVVSARNDAATNLSVARDGRTVHMFCAGSGTTISERIFSELGRFNRGVGAPVVLLLSRPIADPIRIRCRELTIVPLSWSDLDQLSRIERPKAETISKERSEMLPA